MSPFTSHPDDQLWKFKIKDLFPHDDELARHVLIVLTANEDLSNIERFKTLLETEQPRPGIDEIARAKWNRGHFFLAKLRMGFLHNVWKEILGEGKETSPLAILISTLGNEVLESYEALRNTVNICPKTKNILKSFRNRTSFHYDQRQFEKALEIGADDTGEIIQGDSDVHFIVAYQVLDLIPAGRPSREDVLKVKDEIELIQNKFHDFVRVLLLAYIEFRSLMNKVKITKSSSSKSITMRYDLVAELAGRSPQIANMRLAGGLPNETLVGSLRSFANTPANLDRVARAVEALVMCAGLTTTDAMNSIRNLLSSSPSAFYGNYCELSAYDWLQRHGALFHAQTPVTNKDVLNPNGCILDGRFDIIMTYFDIKAMGFHAYVAEQFRHRLETKLPGFHVTIEGPMDVAVKDIETNAFGIIDRLAQSLKAGGVQSIPQLGWTLRAGPPQKITTAVHTTDPYRLALENRHFPFLDAGQFTRHASFMLILPYAAQFNHALFTNFSQSTEVTLRSIARRAFIQLTSDTTPAQQFDKRVPSGILLSEASRLLSALLFINIDNDEAALFLNPRAKYPLTSYHVSQIFDFAPPLSMMIDDFIHDDY